MSSKSKSQTGVYKAGGSSAFIQDSSEKLRNLNVEFGADDINGHQNKNRKSKLNRSSQRF